MRLACAVAACAALVTAPEVARAQADALRDQVPAARAAAVYVLDRSASARTPGEPIFLVTLTRGEWAGTDSARVVSWDSTRVAALRRALAGRLARGPHPRTDGLGRSVSPYTELVITPPVIMGASAQLDVGLCRVRAGGRFCGGPVFGVALRRQGPDWVVESAGETGAF